MANVILPGTYITVRDEGLIGVGGVSVGNVGVVGTAGQGDVNKVYTLSSYTGAKEIFGADESAGTLLKSLQLIFGNGASNVYAVRAAKDTANDYETALAALENELVNIVLLAGQDAGKADMMTKLANHIATTESIRRERVAVVGCNGKTGVDDILANKDATVNDRGRMIYVGPGVSLRKRDPATGDVTEETLSGAYTAAAVAGLIASLPVQTSPTNKTINISGLAANFNHGQLEKLVQGNVLAVEKRQGYRIVKGVTTSTNLAWHQITTRRIVDKAIYGTRAACDPYIGKLNNERVRSAMKATLDGFLTRMVEEEALVTYDLSVTATRAQEIAGQAIVSMTINPTFSIDFIMVTMTLG